MSLRRTRHGEGTPRGQEFSAIFHAVHFVGMGEQAGVLVHDQRIVLPAVPAAVDDFHELVGAVVAQVVREMHLAAHVLRLAVVDRSHYVPCGATAQHVVHRLEAPRHVERFVVGRGCGGTDAKALGTEAHCQQRRHRIELHHAHAIRDDCRGVAAFIDVRHREPIIEEGELEFSFFQHLADLLVIGGGGEIGAAFGMPPGACERRAVLRLQETDHDHLAHCTLLRQRKSRRIASITESQSPGFGWRYSRIVGYHGLSVRPSSQR